MPTALVIDERMVAKHAALLARPQLRSLLADARRYPHSYDRERVMEEADRILDHALDTADRLVGRTPRPAGEGACIVCDDDPRANCEFCL